MLTPAQLKSTLQAHGLRLTKRLGQHHLVDARAIGRVIQRCRLSAGETVVEIGAGLGALTEPLAAEARRVVAVEVDRRIAAALADRLRRLPNVAVICQDILAFDWSQAAGAVVVGAIPYHITSPILVSLTEHRRLIRRAILILQEEVAGRLVAKPGTKAYSRLSVLAQHGWELRPLLRLPRSAFFPQPEVDSSCLELVPRRRPAAAVRDEPRFFELVKTAFAHRRKTLANCLRASPALGLSAQEAASLIRRAGLPTAVRGEALSLEQFAALASLLKK
jgi:16S rRNA (adenine1518-N6/adenine1519-N6)-dimethyltransferase